MVKFIFLSIIILSGYPNLKAQESIDLNEAIRIALQNNTAVSNLEKSLLIQQLTVQTTRGDLYPDLSVSANWNRNNTFSEGTVRFQNGVPVTIPKQDTWINNFSLGLNTSVTIFNGFANYEQVELERQNETLIRTRLNKERYDVVYRVNSAFFSVLKNEKIVIANRDNLKDSQDQLESVRAFMSVGKRTMADVFKQDVLVAQNELALERSLNNLDKSKIDLLFAINTDLDKEYTISDNTIDVNLSDENLKLVLEKNSNTDMLVNQAFENRFDYKNTVQDIRINQVQFNIDKKNLYYPTVDFFSNYNLNASRFQDIQNSRSLSFGLSISYPIFQGFRLNNKAQTTEILIRQRRDDLRQLEQQIRSEIKKSYLDLETFYKQIEILNRNIISAEQDKLLSEENYRVGLGTLLDVQTATTSLNSLIIDRINAYYDFLLGERTLNYYVGNLNYR